MREVKKQRRNWAGMSTRNINKHATELAIRLRLEKSGYHNAHQLDVCTLRASLTPRQRVGRLCTERFEPSGMKPVSEPTHFTMGRILRKSSVLARLAHWNITISGEVMIAPASLNRSMAISRF